MRHKEGIECGESDEMRKWTVMVLPHKLNAFVNGALFPHLMFYTP